MISYMRLIYRINFDEFRFLCGGRPLGEGKLQRKHAWSRDIAFTNPPGGLATWREISSLWRAITRHMRLQLAKWFGGTGSNEMTALGLPPFFWPHSLRVQATSVLGQALKERPKSYPELYLHEQTQRPEHAEWHNRRLE